MAPDRVNSGEKLNRATRILLSRNSCWRSIQSQNRVKRITIRIARRPRVPRPCTICAHPQRIDIESSVLGGISIRSAARAAGISWSALQRHLKHLPAAIAKSVEGEALQLAACGKLPARIEELIAQTRQILKSAKKKNDFHAALAAIRANLSCLEMLGKISGELRPGAGEFVPANVAAVQVNVVPATPEEEKDPQRLVRLMCEVYSLPYPRGGTPPSVQ
jgi:hypothetical protein